MTFSIPVLEGFKKIRPELGCDDAFDAFEGMVSMVSRRFLIGIGTSPESEYMGVLKGYPTSINTDLFETVCNLI